MAFEKPIPLPYASGDRKQLSYKEFLLDVLDDHARLHWMLLHFVDTAPEDTGIIRFAGLGDSTGLVEQQTVPNMTVKFNKAMGFVNRNPFLITSVTNSATRTAPTGDDRIDCVVINPATQAYEIITGVEDASPVAPAVDETVYAKVAEILMYVGMTSIVTADITPTQNFYDALLPSSGAATYGTIYIPGGYMIPSNNVAPSDGLESANYGTNALSYQVFDPAEAQVAMFEFMLPYDFDNALPINFQLNWSSDDTTTGTIAFDLFIIPASGGILLDDDTAVDSGGVSDANESTADERHVTALSTDITLAGSPGDHYIAKLQYSPETGDIANLIRVHSLSIRYTKLTGA